MSSTALFLLSALLISAGIAGFFVRKDLLTMLLSGEVALSGANLALLVFATRSSPTEAQAAVIAILTVAAAEVAVALAAIAVAIRDKGKATEDIASEMKG